MMGKKNKYGNYLFKIGYLDIRQSITMPRNTKIRGVMQKTKGNVEVFVYHGKHKVAGPFKSHTEAAKTAEVLLVEGFKYNKHKK
tara:strand:- start:479 stop:730 length:252 start_codon:yes stop_codon:yes gene_type:complete